jgi:hypothetical protein
MFIIPKKVKMTMAGFKERVPCTEVSHMLPLVSDPAVITTYLLAQNGQVPHT